MPTQRLTSVENRDVFTPVRQIATHELAEEQIRIAIMTGRFQNGESLPPERDMAKFMGVSRTTVRDAIATLVKEGLITVKRGRYGGYFVRIDSVDAEETRRLLRRSQEWLRDIFDFREIVESASAGLAAERRTNSQLKEIRLLFDKMEDMKDGDGTIPEDPDLSARFNALDTDFHASIAGASGNTWLNDATMNVRTQIFYPVGALFNRLRPNADYLHADIVAAIEDQDARKASVMMTEHIKSTRQHFEHWLNA